MVNGLTFAMLLNILPWQCRIALIPAVEVVAFPRPTYLYAFRSSGFEHHAHLGYRDWLTSSFCNQVRSDILLFQIRSLKARKEHVLCTWTINHLLALYFTTIILNGFDTMRLSLHLAEPIEAPFAVESARLAAGVADSRDGSTGGRAVTAGVKLPVSWDKGSPGVDGSLPAACWDA